MRATRTLDVGFRARDFPCESQERIDPPYIRKLVYEDEGEEEEEEEDEEEGYRLDAERDTQNGRDLIGYRPRGRRPETMIATRTSSTILIGISGSSIDNAGALEAL